MIYRLQLNVYADDPDINDETVWSEFYFDVTKIIGFRVFSETCTKTEDKASFIYTNGDVFLIKNEPHIMRYLLEKFYDKAIIK